MLLNKRYALLHGNTVFAIFEIPGDHQLASKMQAAFATGVTGMDVTSFPEAGEGWEWDGNKFIQLVEGGSSDS